MQACQLPFAEIKILRPDVAEVIIHDGVEMDTNMVHQYHDTLLDHLSAPFSLLINKLHAYTYTFEAQKILGTLPEINAMAVIVYNDVSKISTNSLATFPRETPWNIQIFHDRHSAMSWLDLQQNNINS